MAIKCSEDYGPWFGDSAELMAQEPFNEEKKCQSWANGKGYKVPQDSEKRNMLTNQKDGYFTI